MSTVIDIEYEQPACSTQRAWARVPVEPSAEQRAELKARIKRLLKERNAVINLSLQSIQHIRKN